MNLKNMVEENMDQDLDETPEVEPEEEQESPVEEAEETEGEVVEEQSEETTPEPAPDINEAIRLTKALQKGYTLTRQEQAVIRRNQEEILEHLRKKNEPEFDSDEPMTVGKFQEIMKRQTESSIRDKDNVHKIINSQLDELRAEGVIDTQEEEDELLKYATERGKKDLLSAGRDWQELKEAKKLAEKVKAKARANVKKEAGSKVGTSQKTKTETTGEIPYEDIHGKSMDEILNEE